MGRPKTDRHACYLLWLTAAQDARLTQLEEASGKTRRDILGTLIEEASLSAFKASRRAQAPRGEAFDPPTATGLASSLAARVKAGGARRQAIEVTTGKVVEEGRTRR